MPTQTQIQNTLLSARGILANLALANLSQLRVGNNEVKWAEPRRFMRNILALQAQLNFGDYTSTQTLQLYDCLNTLIGIDPAVNTIDPNYQPPSGEIIITNPNTYLQPVDLVFTDFDPASQQIDGGRITYLNPLWKGINPQMQISSPGLTSLYVALDYVLVPSGGFTLLISGNLPELYDGQDIRVTGYRTA